MDFKRKFIITDEYRKQMQVDTSVNAGNAKDFLLSHSLKLANYLDDWRRLKREFIELNKELTGIKKDKWSFYRFKHSFQTSTTDADRLTANDTDLMEYQSLLDEIELDIKFLEKYMESLSGKSFSINNWIKLSMFENGEKM